MLLSKTQKRLKKIQARIRVSLLRIRLAEDARTFVHALSLRSLQGLATWRCMQMQVLRILLSVR